MARVYENGVATFIDYSGNPVLEHGFKSMEPFGPHTYSIARTLGGKPALVDRRGQLLADTLFSHIGPFQDGRSVVVSARKKWDKKKRTDQWTYKYGVIDTAGCLVVPLGRFKKIEPYY